MSIWRVGRVALAVLLGLGGVLLCAAKAPKEAPPAESFLSGDFFSNGMALADAEKLVADPEQWQVVFRIDTPSTADMAVVWRRQYFWRTSFYKGSLYAIEKRGEVEPEVVEATVRALGEQHGESREATRSEDGSLVYSRWRLDHREISFTASREPDGLYRVTYEEADTDMLSIARRKQEQEMQEAPGDIDPLTGKVRIRKPGDKKTPPASDEDNSAKGRAKQKNKPKDKKPPKEKPPKGDAPKEKPPADPPAADPPKEDPPKDDPPAEDPPAEDAGDDSQTWGDSHTDGDGEDAEGESAKDKKPPARRDDPGDW